MTCSRGLPLVVESCSKLGRADRRDQNEAELQQQAGQHNLQSMLHQALSTVSVPTAQQGHSLLQQQAQHLHQQ